MKRITILAVAIALVLAATASATSVYFDFGDSSQQTAGNYNNLWTNSTTPQLSVANAIDSTGGSTGIGLAIVPGTFYPGSNTTGTTTPSGSVAIFASQATRDNVFGHTGAFGGNPDASLGIVSLTGLNPSLTYDFVFFGSRTGVTDNRETEYNVSGLTSGVAYLNTSNNTSNTVSVLGISPTALGNATVYVDAGPNNNNASKFYYLGAMELSYTPVVPEPASLMLLSVSVVVLGIRRASRLS